MLRLYVLYKIHIQETARDFFFVVKFLPRANIFISRRGFIICALNSFIGHSNKEQFIIEESSSCSAKETIFLIDGDDVGNEI